MSNRLNDLMREQGMPMCAEECDHESAVTEVRRIMIETNGRSNVEHMLGMRLDHVSDNGSLIGDPREEI